MDGTTFRICPADSPSLPETIRRTAQEPERIHSFSGSMYLHWGDQIICCPDTEEGKAFLEQLVRPGKEESDAQETEKWKRLLNGETVPDAESFIRTFCPGLTGKSGVIVFRALSEDRREDLRQAKDLLPLEVSDAFIRYDRDTFVIIRKSSNAQELADFAAAVIDTVYTETGIILKAGIGRPAEGPAGLPASFAEAAQALRTGERFRLSDPVFLFDSLRIERIVDMIPDAEQQLLKAEYLSSGKAKLLSEEMLDTVQAYLENDMNLSNTARKLFIHRNTLIYRLDKIRKEIGLDVRNFQDAMVLEILICILKKDTQAPA